MDEIRKPTPDRADCRGNALQRSHKQTIKNADERQSQTHTLTKSKKGPLSMLVNALVCACLKEGPGSGPATSSSTSLRVLESMFSSISAPALMYVLHMRSASFFRLCGDCRAVFESTDQQSALRARC